DGPEDEGRKEGRGGVNFTFDGAIPEGVAKGIGEGADNTGGQDGKGLLLVGFRVGIIRGYAVGCDALHDQFPGEVRDRPKEKKDRKTTGDRAHEVDTAGSCMRIVTEEDDEEATHEYEQRGAGRVGDLELIAAGDELSAIPEAAGGLHGHDKDGAG